MGNWTHAEIAEALFQLGGLALILVFVWLMLSLECAAFGACEF